MSTRLTGEEEATVTLQLMEMVTIRLALAALKMTMPQRVDYIDNILSKFRDVMLEMEE
tara:strand:+ start:24 stop:197 length:174 start_codon:yes stop_codon:yes gene_type:complete